MYLSFLSSVQSRMKSAVQIRGGSSSLRAALIEGSSVKKKSTKTCQSLGLSYLYLAPEKRVAEKASAFSAGFLWTTKMGLAPTRRILIYPSLILGRNCISTNIPFSPMMYFSQNSMNSPSCLCSTWLSTASVHLILVSRGRESPFLYSLSSS